MLILRSGAGNPASRFIRRTRRRRRSPRLLRNKAPGPCRIGQRRCKGPERHVGVPEIGAAIVYGDRGQPETQPPVVAGVGELIGERPRFGEHASPHRRPFVECVQYLALQGLLALQIQPARQVKVGRELLPSRLVSGLPDRRPQPASTVRRLTVVHPGPYLLPRVPCRRSTTGPVGHYFSRRCRSASSSSG
jgi:hypothetical protein